jgi:preprotein translocase subunit SecB
MIERLLRDQEEFMQEQKITNQLVTDQIKELNIKIDRLTTHRKMLETQVTQLGIFQIQAMRREHIDVIFSSSENKNQEAKE